MKVCSVISAKVSMTTGFLVNSLSKAPFPRLLSLVLVVPKFFHFRITEGIFLLGTLKDLDFFIVGLQRVAWTIWLFVLPCSVN